MTCHFCGINKRWKKGENILKNRFLFFYFSGELVVKAMSFIIPNTQPPSGVVTKVAGIVRMMQPVR